MRHSRDRALESGRSRAPLDVPRVDDQPRRRREHLAGERELLGPRLPQRRQPLVEHAVREASDDAVLALHRVEVAVPVAATDRDPRHEVVEDEVVQDDEPWSTRSASRIQPCASGLFPMW